MSLQCVLLAKMTSSILGCIRQSLARMSREVMLPLYSAQLRHVWSAVSCPGLPSTRNIDMLEGIQWKAIKMIKVCDTRRESKSWSWSPWRRKGSGESYQVEKTESEVSQWIPVMDWERWEVTTEIWDIWFRNMTNFFPAKMVKALVSIAKANVESLCLELNPTLGSLLLLTLLWAGQLGWGGL